MALLEDVRDVVLQRLSLCSEDRLNTVADLDDTCRSETAQTGLIHFARVRDVHAQARDTSVDIHEVLSAAERRNELLGLTVSRQPGQVQAQCRPPERRNPRYRHRR